MVLGDKSPETIYISPSGAVVMIEKNGKQLRFLTCTLPQIFHKNVLELVDFRNRHVVENLYLTQTLGNHVDLLMEVSALRPDAREIQS